MLRTMTCVCCLYYHVPIVRFRHACARDIFISLCSGHEGLGDHTSCRLTDQPTTPFPGACASALYSTHEPTSKTTSQKNADRYTHYTTEALRGFLAVNYLYVEQTRIEK